jgi:uncharacterized protein
MRPLPTAALAFCALLVSAWPGGAQTLSKPTGKKVADLAGVLTPSGRADLEALLATLERDTKAEVYVATTTSLGGVTVEEYANRVFNEWRIGKAALDNGVLVLVAPGERKMRIEVGYGLEPVIPDVLAGAIIRDDCLPRFRDGEYEAGIVAGVRHVAEIVRAKQVLTPAQLAALKAPSSRTTVLDRLLFGAFALMWLAGVCMAGAAAGQAVHVRSGPNLLFGVFGLAIFAGVPIYLVTFTAFVIVPVAVAGGVWGYRRRPLAGRSSRGDSSSGWDWSTSSGSSSSDYYGSSGDSGGSSDSGGGSSGGGGASGSW